MKPKRSRRWIRAVAPFVVLLAWWLFTGIAHLVERPNLGDPGTLSPQGTGPDGSSALAAALTSRGVTIDRVTSSALALAAATDTDATIFLPTPDFLDPAFVSAVDKLGGHHRLVVVQPGMFALMAATAPIYPAGTRWATAAVAPHCTTPYAVAAGRAAMLRTVYVVDGAATSTDCYGGGLVGVRAGDLETIYVGATDPFRNSRFNETGNAAIATGVLAEYGHVIWVDVHKREISVRVTLPQVKLPHYRRGVLDRSDTGNPTIDAFPTVLWAGLVLAFVAALLFAVARARRLGPPVAEPLPVLVPAAEAVTGRGRLYHRIHARGATLTTLRAAAIVRIARVLNPPGVVLPERDLVPRGETPPPAADGFIAQIADHTGLPTPAVRRILYGPLPDDDDALARDVADLDRLVHTIVYERPAPDHRGGTP